MRSPGKTLGRNLSLPPQSPPHPGYSGQGRRTPAPLTRAPTTPCCTPRVSIPRNAAPGSTVLRNSAGASGKEAGPHPGGGCPGRPRGGSPAPSRPRRAVAEGLLRVNVLVSNPPRRPHARHSLQPPREPRPRGLPTWRLQSPKGP